MGTLATLSPQTTGFIRFEIEGQKPSRQKKALQMLVRLLRAGDLLPATDRFKLEQSIVGLLHSSSDHKVIRWCLNSLALIGKPETSEHAVNAAISNNLHQTDIVAAGIAALSSFFSGKFPDEKILREIEPEIRVLAALQNCAPDDLDFRGVNIDLDKADSETLKLALVVVGLDKAYPNIFHPKHPNETFITELGQHDDSVVVQYSVWSAIANPNFGTKHVGIDPADLERLPDNVQSKYLQLISQKESDLQLRHDMVGRGHILPSVSAREGLAHGIMRRYYEGLEEITVDWFDRETSEIVKRRLAEHFARNSKNCAIYHNKVQDIFDSDQDFRQDILLGAERTKLFPILKAKDISQSTLDLFGDTVGSEVIDNISQSASPPKLPQKTVLMFFAAPDDLGRLNCTMK